MTKTKEVDVRNSPTHFSFASSKERRLHLRQKMENGGGTEGSDAGHTQHADGELSGSPAAPTPGEKKKVNRAPSPARPKDVPGWSLTKIRGGIGNPTLSVKPGAIHLGSRVSRRSPVGSLAGSGKADKSKPAGRSSFSAGGMSKSATAAKGAKSTGGRRKVSDASIGSDDLSKDSGCPTGKLSPTDSSSELSDCASEENKLSTDAVSSDAESRSSRGGGVDVEKPAKDGTAAAARSGHKAPAAANTTSSTSKTTCSSAEKDYKERLSLGVDTGEGSISPGEERSVTSFDSRMPASTSLAFSDLTEEFIDGMHEEFVREIEELRSENEYLKVSSAHFREPLDAVAN